MIFDRIRLRNFKPYADTDLRLSDGVTVIHGLNGSGKSSLLEACFFALYGSKALDGTLGDVVTNGAEESEVELWFTHDGRSYHVRRELKRYGDQIQTTTCTLDSDDETVHRDGATDVRAFVSDLLRMDAEAFVNCAYVRQGEVNKLINATPTERQDMIDDLLQLGTLEEYRDRAGDARLGVEDVRSTTRGALENVEEQVAEKEDRGLHGRLNSLESTLSEVNEKIENYEAQREKAASTREEARDVLDEYEERREELTELESDIEDLEATIREDEAERERIGDRIADLRDRVDDAEATLAERLSAVAIDDADPETLDARRDHLDDRETDLREELRETRSEVNALTNQSENLAEKADEAADRADEKRTRAAELDEDAEAAAETLAEREESLAELETEREELRATFEDAPVAVGEASAHRESVREELEAVRAEVRETSNEASAARSSVEEAEELLAEGKCPECGQPVDGSPHVDGLDDERERLDELEAELADLTERETDLEGKLDRAETLVEAENRLGQIADTRELIEDGIAEKEDEIAQARERAAELREAAEDLESQSTEKREVSERKAEEAEEARADAEALEADLDDIETARDRLDAVEAAREEIADAEEEIDRLTEKRVDVADRNDERREFLATKRERRDELRDAFDDERVESARERLENAEEYIENVDDALDDLRERRDDLTSRIGAVENELEELEALRGRRDELADRLAELDAIHEETEDLEAMYGDLRAELRRANVESLERMLNETFELVYGNDAYSHIELDGEYELTVYQKDGEPLDPEQLSGGERALFNLSLRCAIYRLLAEGIEGAAPTPPLILDEPTVFLDSGHVSRLADLIDEMRGFGVRQILIVSHDDELVDAADELVRVEKDPTSNRSTVERLADPSLSAVRARAGDAEHAGD
ncbi:DNA double-strand break repair ATPase Rad50 [Halobaculum sp. WSA2]|uniref:DNA double-strand break repair Rad50 ATPase n=1 Tax=Halobaculum saliterrae TaxID=2073113 RepID=A0A6B0SQL5_9EURY|nr:DNA double-strand break repair ATPase Rad50 [Halobaculum saliterrae]MXR41224.1 DNA double-strand break repair ATPase Rad50 [Halobaculum saliterrae]